MKSQLHLLTLALLTGSLASFGASTASAQSCDHSLNATYQVTFDAAWSQQNHPADFPGNPHFSGLIGGTHQGSHSFWEVGSLASPGIESMAETGRPLPKKDGTAVPVASSSEHAVTMTGSQAFPQFELTGVSEVICMESILLIDLNSS